MHTAAAQAAAPAAALAADPWIHGSMDPYLLLWTTDARNENLQKAEKSRGWPEISRFSDQIDGVDANYFLNFVRTSEQTNEASETNEKFRNFCSQNVVLFCIIKLCGPYMS